MSDISIPGVSNKYNTDKMIEELMRLERIPLTRMENQVKDYEFQRQSWRELNLSLTRFRDASRKLYGFQNPFNDRVAQSSDTSYLTASANREAPEETAEIEIIQTAAADRLLSASLDEDFTVPEGTYGFQIGDKEISIRFRGGSLKSFADTINRRGENLLKASVVRNTASTQILSLEASKTGEKNRLFFEDDSLPLALNLGLIRENQAEVLRFTPLKSDFRPWDKPMGNDDLIALESGVTFMPGNRGKIPLNLSEDKASDLVLEFTVLTKTIAAEDTPGSAPPPGPAIPATGTISYDNLSIYSESSLVDLPKWTPPAPPPRNDDLSVFFLQDGENILPLENINAGDGTQSYRIVLSERVGDLTSLNVRNNNTHREITISDVNIYNPEIRGDHVAANPISTARDSRIRINGVPVTRDSNVIEDVITGVTLNLKKATDTPLTVEVGPDRETVKEEIINFIGTYNRIIADINILTSSDPVIIEQLEYFTPEEKEASRKKLGLYQGDSTLIQMKTRLQRVMMDSYRTSAEESMALLAQMGISTNSNRGGGFDTSRLRGYLEIQEDTLDKNLENLFPAVKELFGSDSNGDLIIDSGVAWQLDNYIKSYVDTGGIISYKITSLDTRIDRSNNEIEDYKIKLDDKEAELKQKYGIMEGTLEGLQNSTRALENLNNNNRNN